MKNIFISLVIIFSLNSICFALDKQPVPIAPRKSSFHDYGKIILIEGSLVGEDRKYDPVNPNVISIDCPDINAKTCILFSAMIQVEEGHTSVLTVVAYTYEIKFRDANKVIAETNDDVCHVQRLIINRKLKTVERVSIPKAEGDEFYSKDFCGKFDNKKMSTEYLIDGNAAWRKEITDNCKKYFSNCGGN